MPISVPERVKVVLFPGKPNEREAEAKILNVAPLTTFPDPMTPVLSLAITYQRETLPPRVIWIEKDEYTEGVLKESLRKDMEAQRLARGPFEIT